MAMAMGRQAERFVRPGETLEAPVFLTLFGFITSVILMAMAMGSTQNRAASFRSLP